MVASLHDPDGRVAVARLPRRRPCRRTRRCARRSMPCLRCRRLLRRDRRRAAGLVGDGAEPARAAMARADARAERAMGRLSGPGHENRDPGLGRTPRSPADSFPARSPLQCMPAIVAHLAPSLPGRIQARDRGRRATIATRAYAIDPANPALAAAEAVLERLYGRRPCAWPWAPRCRSPSCSSACSASTWSSSVSPPPTRTITPRMSSSASGGFATAYQPGPALLARLGCQETPLLGLSRARKLLLANARRYTLSEIRARVAAACRNVRSSGQEAAAPAPNSSEI